MAGFVKGEVVVIPFPFSDLSAAKRRPALVLADLPGDDIMLDLKDFEGYLNIGRQTADNSREIYFACKDFRKPSKVLYELTKKYSGQLDLTYDIYKDKYWRSYERFRRY
jgi:hypothetical protein